MAENNETKKEEVKKTKTEKVTPKETKEKSKPEANKEIIAYAVGRRKRAIAKVRMYSGSGKVTINDKEVKKFFSLVDQHEKTVSKPLILSGVNETHDFTIKVTGGGTTGQVEACRMGISRCIAKLGEDTKKTMKQNGYLTRDPREKERKKVYRIGARKAPQFSKR